jgi:predicted PhzF superfamily epimerase YddE/YHI9
MTIPIYQVDAFTDTLFGGNPAAVCPLEDWPTDDLLQKNSDGK